MARGTTADGKLTVEVTFDKPGTYILRSHADDGALTADGQVTITVTRCRSRSPFAIRAARSLTARVGPGSMAESGSTSSTCIG